MPFQILSLSGGGFLGLYTIAVLAELEKKLGRPIATAFDLLAGTSVGGILALGLAAEHSAEKIKSSFEEHGTRIFSDRPPPQSWPSELIDFFRSFRSSKYNSEGLRQTIVDVLGEETLIGDLKHPVLVPTVNLTKGKPQIFKTPHHPDFKRDYQLSAVDVALATSAAPTYFPIAQINDEQFADGGLYGNSPDLMALHEAEYFFKVPTDDIYILSIGTTTSKFSIAHLEHRNLGIWGWKRRLSHTILSSQQLDVHYVVKQKLGDRYLRVDEVQSKEQERSLGLDVATQQAQKTIRGLASASFQNILNKPLLTKLLEHHAPPAHFHYSKNYSEEWSI
ncbi:MAG: CBASS cGAMP-activated phospholipase [Nitrospirales bacterium]